MKIITYKLVILFFFVNSVLNAQQFEKKLVKEINTHGKKVNLKADYADIEIKEWDKDKIKIDAVMRVHGVSKDEAEAYFNSWEISLTSNKEIASIISKTSNLYFSGLENFNGTIVNFPEVSIESLGVLDSIDFSFPEINFSDVYENEIFEKLNSYNFEVLDSLGKIDFDKLTLNAEYLKKWHNENHEKLAKISNKYKDLNNRLEVANKQLSKQQKERGKMLKKRKENVKKRAKLLKQMNKRRALRNKKRAELKGKMLQKMAARSEKTKLLHKKIQEHRKKVKTIIDNRKKAKVRTKLIITVPKGTKFNMNVNYSKIKMN